MAETQHLKPTLVVGVGGIGCWIADRVFEMATETGAAASNRMAVLGFDTDENDIDALTHLGRDQLVRTSTADTVFTLLGRRGEPLRSWFVDDESLTTELRQMTLLDGAGAVRMLSRLAFDEALSRVQTAARIDSALAALATHDNRTGFDGRVNVLVVGSLAGGTGSGMFMQTALVLADRLRALGITAQVRGLFLLPDIVVQAARLPADQVAGVRANGYAALKELHAVTLFCRDRSARDVALEYVRGAQLRPDAPPFESLVLMDYEGQRGGNLGNNFNAYRELAARAAYTLMFTPIGGRYDSQTVNDVRARLAAAADQTDNSLAGIGLSAAVYPQARILDYLALRFGMSLLDDDWLRLDQAYRQELERYHARVNSGETSLEPPDVGASYIRNLEQLAGAERVAFFRRIQQGVYREEEDPRGNVSVRPQYRLFLDALERHLTEAFWDSAPALRQAKGREDLGADSLTDKDALPQDVGLYERQLRTDFEAVEQALSAIAAELFHTSVVGAGLLGAGEWREHHLERHIVHGGPHLVQVRYFLYKLRGLIRERLAGLGDERKRKTIERNLHEAFDNPETGVIETATDVAAVLAQSVWPDWADRRFKRFQLDYREHYNRTRALNQALGREGLLRQVYALLDQHVARLLDVITRFFEDLAALRDQLALERNRMEAEHGGSSDGSRYVLADAPAKNALWDDLAARLQGLATGGDAVNAALTKALITRFRDEGQANRWQVLAPFSGSALFRERMLKGWCRERIIQEQGDLYRLPVIEAIRREAILRGRAPDDYLAEVVDLVGRQSAPYLALTSPDAGQLYRFWAIGSVNRERFGNPADFDRLFTSDMGETPVVEPEFPAHTLLCISTVVNLRFADLRKLATGALGHTNVSAPQAGSYHGAYRAMVDRLLDHEARAPQTPPPTFTPHLDKHWHRPGGLPELHPELDAAHERDLLDAYVLGIALDLLPLAEREGRSVTLLRDPARLGQPDYETVIADDHDDLALLERLRAEPRRIRVLLAQPHAILADAAPHDQLYAGLTRAATLARLCRIMADRTRAEEVDGLASDAIDRLLEHLSVVGARHHRTLGTLSRQVRLQEDAEALVTAAVAELTDVLEPDTLDRAGRLARNKLRARLGAA